MQSVLVYGRVLARAVVNGYQSAVNSSASSQSVAGDAVEAGRGRYGLVAATCGLSDKVVCCSPHALPSGRKGVYGDDACFVAENHHSHVIGVADGVGGWRHYGIDPSQFSATLMETCERLVKQGRFTARQPVGLLAASYYELLESKVPVLGSSTACVLMLDKQERTIYTANLGDSGFMVVRDGQVVHRSNEQQHYFNTPFQLASAPPSLQLGEAAISDRPESADSTVFGVESGDLIVLGTDGLFDNLSEAMILNVLSRIKERNSRNIQHAATSLAERALQLSLDPDYISPFARNARTHGIDIKGGKPDDITVVISAIQPFE